VKSGPFIPLWNVSGHTQTNNHHQHQRLHTKVLRHNSRPRCVNKMGIPSCSPLYLITWRNEAVLPAEGTSAQFYTRFGQTVPEVHRSPAPASIQTHGHPLRGMKVLITRRVQHIKLAVRVRDTHSFNRSRLRSSVCAPYLRGNPRRACASQSTSQTVSLTGSGICLNGRNRQLNRIRALPRRPNPHFHFES